MYKLVRIVSLVLVAFLVEAFVPAGASEIYSLSDTDVASGSVSQIAAQLGSQKAQDCKFTAPRRKALSLATALTNARNFVDSHTDQSARDGFSSSPESGTEASSIEAAVEAQSANEPYAALLALLHAHELAPDDPMPLIDAAPLLVEDALPNEALAFLAAAKKLQQPASTAMGIKSKELISNNEGFALLGLRAWSAAQKKLQRVVTKDPFFTEARDNLAQALLCQGEKKPAAKAIFLAAWRNPQIAGDLVEQSPTVPTPTQAGIDITHGTDITLPTWTLPQNVQQGKATNQAWNDLFDQALSTGDAHFTQWWDDRSQLTSDEASMAPATRRRIEGLIAVGGDSIEDPTIWPLAQHSLDMEQQAEVYMDSKVNPACDDGDHATALGLLQNWDVAWHEYVHAVYNLETAAGANLKNPTAHEMVMLNASSIADYEMTSFLQYVANLTTGDTRCDQNDEAAQDPVSDPTDSRPASPLCPSGLEGKGFSVSLVGVQLSVDCENVAAEVSPGGWLTGFVNVSHNFRDGSTTIYGGPRANLNPEVWGPNATVQDGVYVKFDSSGAIQDVGARVENGSSIGAGDIGVSASGDSMNFSFVGSSPIGQAALKN